MKRKPKIVLGLKGRSDSNIASLTHVAIISITGNPYFVNAAAELQNLLTANKAYADVLAAAKSRDNVKVEKRETPGWHWNLPLKPWPVL